MMAPRHHGAMRHVASTRIDLGTRTIFNLMGPLCNPARAKRQLVGVFGQSWLEPVAEVLARLGSTRAWVVHGGDGLDELTTTTSSHVAELKDGRIRTFDVSPEMVGLPMARPEDLIGGDAVANAEALQALLEAAPGPYRDIVLLNSAAALVVAEKAADLKEGVMLAAEAIDSGKARIVLRRLIAMTNEAVG
jgi:anthranilate phosphoribosyltransferase